MFFKFFWCFLTEIHFLAAFINYVSFNIGFIRNVSFYFVPSIFMNSNLYFCMVPKIFLSYCAD